jgi:mono/diheme cytochrome c family protein
MTPRLCFALASAVLLLVCHEPAMAEEADGALTFESRCGFCHAAPGESGGEAPIRRATLEHETGFSAVVRQGRNGARGAMPAFGANTLSDEQVRAIRRYLLQETEESAARPAASHP